MSTEVRELEQAAARLGTLLLARRVHVVFAESCTAGLVAASLAQTPGISQWLCGSAVTYRDRTKQQWLGVEARRLRQFGAVSAPVAEQMARGVLTHTSDARYAWSVTGHLGPDAPQSLDGVVFIAGAVRENSSVQTSAARRFVLSSKLRVARQREAATIVLEEALRTLSQD